MDRMHRKHALDRENVSTQQKAFDINLDQNRYGTFAEIGAGQEVVRWFFQAGGAAGTIAKSMSAYDMAVSDAIYGTAKRYVSRERLYAMLDHEYDLLVDRLNDKRGDSATFFVFADTVAARSYSSKHQAHGWMGIRFQAAPRAQPSQIVMHVRMLDVENVSQQGALGIVGVNLIHGAFCHHDNPDRLLAALLDELSPERIEIDMIKFSGPAFAGIDHRLMSLELVRSGLSKAAMFSPSGEVLQPSEAFYKKPIVVERGRFRPVTYAHVDVLECAREEFIRDLAEPPSDLVQVMEITMSNLLETGELDPQDFLIRADMLAATGANVLISDYPEHHRLANYLAGHTDKEIGIAMGLPTLVDLFDEKFYEDLDGGILEGFGRLFKSGTRLYVYPYKNPQTGELTTVQKLKVAPHLQNLYEHMIENGYIRSIDYYNKQYLDIFSIDVLTKIQNREDDWERMVPAPVAEVIKKSSYFGHATASADAG